MPSERDKTEVIVADWLAQFERALPGDSEKLATLFHADSHWRDVLALTWSIETVSGCDGVPSTAMMSPIPLRSEGEASRIWPPVGVVA